MSPETVEKSVTLLRALAHPVRFKILLVLFGHPYRKEPLQVIRESVGVSKANLSQHLSILVKAGLIRVVPTGRTSYAEVTRSGSLRVAIQAVVSHVEGSPSVKEVW